MKRRSAARAALLLAFVQVAACGRPARDAAGAAGEPVPSDWPSRVRRALEDGEIAVVEDLMERGLEPDLILPAAAAADETELLRILWRRGADPSGFEASRALFGALAGHHSEAAAALRQAGATLDARDDLGLTQAHAAAARGRTADLRRLLALGADGDLATNTGITPLMSAAARGRGRSVELLLAAGARVGARDRDGWTALHYAAHEGEGGIGRLLLAAGSDPGGASELGWTPLHLACRAGAGDLVADLLAAGADPDAAGGAAAPPLVLAVRSGDRKSVAALLAAGADAGRRVRGVDAAWWAERLGNEEASGLLKGAR